MVKKLLVICGPTATGKTKLAVIKAKKYNGELVSADSRQVYRFMDIGTGKNIPKGFEFRISNFGFNNHKVGYYTNDSVRLWGYDLAQPNKSFSVSQYSDIACKIVSDIWVRKHLPIIVGGTGLYIRSLIDGIDTSSIPPDIQLRKVLGKDNTDILFAMLNSIDEEKARVMNSSDRKNPRRLIRAIEVARQVSSIRPACRQGRYQVSRKISFNYDSLLMIGLTASKPIMNERIKRRVNERIKEGFEEEINTLLKKGVNWKYQSMKGLGYRQYEDYNKGFISWKEFVNRWVLEEQRYTKRQMTWFNKDKRVNWIDVSVPDWETEVENKIQSWYYGKDRTR